MTIIPATLGHTIPSPDGSPIQVIAWAIDDDTFEVTAITRVGNAPGDLTIATVPKPGRPPTVLTGTATGPFGLHLAGKRFKMNSFWLVQHDVGKFVFALPPDTASPKDERAEKITRVMMDNYIADGVEKLEWEQVIRETDDEEDDDGMDLV